jgi:hypothetical protein
MMKFICNRHFNLGSCSSSGDPPLPLLPVVPLSDLPLASRTRNKSCLPSCQGCVSRERAIHVRRLLAIYKPYIKIHYTFALRFTLDFDLKCELLNKIHNASISI